jgi:hypothetical protein
MVVGLYLVQQKLVFSEVANRILIRTSDSLEICVGTGPRDSKKRSRTPKHLRVYTF